MHYNFPTITCLDDVRPHIEGRDEIKIMEREIDGQDYLIVDYLVNFPDTFPALTEDMTEEELRTALVRRECRGLIFDAQTEKLLARRYHKFFNINERDETQIGKMRFDRKFIILDKLDGSMVSPFMFPNTDQVQWDVYSSPYLTQTYWGTRKGATEVADGARDYIERSNYDYDDFAHGLILKGWTPIFEWISPRFRIVIDYGHEQMVLTGIRNIKTGRYKSYAEMRKLADEYGIPVVEQISAADIHRFLTEAKSEEDLEGYVLRWADGHMVKSKNEWYMRIHKTKELLVFEKDMIDIILGDDLDDIVAELPPNDQKRVRQYEESLVAGIRRVAGEVQSYVDEAHVALNGLEDREAKKKFATEWVPAYSEPRLKGVLFQTFQGETAFDAVCRFVKDNSGSGPKVDAIRPIIQMEWNSNVVNGDA